MAPIKFGVIGIKGMGRGHIRAINEVEQAQLAAVCDIDATAARAAGEELGVPWHEDYRDMYAAAGIDAVSIATPHYLHAPMAIDAMRAGIHAFTEKPISISAREADAMIAVAAQTGMKLGVCHNRRSAALSRALKEIMAQGRLGRITRVLWTSCGLRTQAYYDSGEWRGTWEQEGGGVLINQTVHDMDLLQWLVGPVVEVSAIIGRLSHRTQVEDIAGAAVKFANGAHGVLQLGLISVPGLSRCEICGDHATIVLGDGEPRIATLHASVLDYIQGKAGVPEKLEPTWEPIVSPAVEQGHKAMIRDFCLAIMENRDPMVTGESARPAVELVNAIIMSSVRGRKVSIPVDRDEYDAVLRELAARKDL